MSSKTVPFNQDAEVYVLGSILIDNNIMNATSGKLNDTDFYNEQNQFIYRAMLSLFKENVKIEPLTVLEEMRRLELALKDDPKAYLLELVDAVPSTASASLYIDIIKEKAVERELLNNMSELSENILTGSLEFNQILDKAEDKIQNIIKKRRTSELLTIEKAATTTYQQIERYTSDKSDLRGLSTGFKRVDKATLGFQKGDLIILAARPSVGKSALALNFALNICKQKKDAHVAFFSLEMSIEQLMMRLFSYQSNIPMSKIQRGQLDPKELILLGHARQELVKYNVYFDESNASDIYEIRSKCRQLKQVDKLDIVIIDYLQLITSNNKGSRQEEVAAISRALKILAKELEVPVIALSQLSRLVETREDKKPVLSDLRESGSIEQDADIVMFLYRPEKKKDEEKEYEVRAKVVDAEGEQDDNGEKVLELIIAKNRQGSLRDIQFTFFPDECRFKESKYTVQIQNIKVPKDGTKE